MSLIESRDEIAALQAAWGALGFEDGDAAEVALFSAGWHAGRDWQRSQDAARRGFRLLGCTHTPSCGSAAQCAERN